MTYIFLLSIWFFQPMSGWDCQERFPQNYAHLKETFLCHKAIKERATAEKYLDMGADVWGIKCEPKPEYNEWGRSVGIHAVCTSFRLKVITSTKIIEEDFP
jgi:hypothetical protein